MMVGAYGKDQKQESSFWRELHIALASACMTPICCVCVIFDPCIVPSLTLYLNKLGDHTVQPFGKRSKLKSRPGQAVKMNFIRSK